MLELDDAGPTVAHPERLKADDGGSTGAVACAEDEADPRVAQPDFLNPDGFASFSTPAAGGVLGGLITAGGLAILIPAAFASFLSSFSSLFLSFSLRLSSSSLAVEDAR